MNRHLNHRSITRVVALLSALGSFSTSASAEGNSAYLGTVFPTLASWCPKDTLPANGQSLPIAGNEALYSVIGTSYGGNGWTHFALPNMIGRTPVGAGQGPGMAMRPIGMTAGSPSVTLRTDQLPPHTHDGELNHVPIDVQINVSTSQATKTTPEHGDLFAAKSAGFSVYKPYVPGNTPGDTVWLKGPQVSKGEDGGTAAIAKNPSFDESTDTARPIPLRPNSLVIKYCVVTKGPFPTRS